mmetsp:Transcript_55789/g.104650  ORF Transcript_55789/g.104650 Transcript_55789/m.104650 type:complete len:189 (-) Transcript_55789:108-674(-)
MMCRNGKSTQGFFDKINKLVKDDAKTFDSLQRRCSVLIMIGHSLGGSMATIYAALARSWKMKKVDYLYTFGAPAISKTPLYHTGITCFPGARFFNFDSDREYDIVPNFAQRFDYVHPLTTAIQLKQSRLPSGEEVYDKVIYECSSNKTWRLPQAITDTEFELDLALVGDALKFHRTLMYIDRLEHIKL